MAKKQKSKRKAKGKSKDTTATPFVPMPRVWPGMIEDDTQFAEFADKVKRELNAKKKDPLVTLRIMQFGFQKTHDFIITLPKNAPIFRLQSEIAKIQHANSVLASDVIIFLREPETPMFVKSKKKDEYPYEPNQPKTTSNYSLSIGVPDSQVCMDSMRSLISYFPEMQHFQIPESYTDRTTTPVFLHNLQLEKPVQKRAPKGFLIDSTSSPSLFQKNNPTNLAEYPTATFPIYYDIRPYARINRYIKETKKQTPSLSNLLTPFKTTDYNPPRESLSNGFDRNCSLLQTNTKKLTPNSIESDFQNLTMLSFRKIEVEQTRHVKNPGFSAVQLLSRLQVLSHSGKSD
ncbi:hypothetical protein BC833DRAFT_596602 [Globomyces pollinis-pini]|nr:hypothetical protein BC833DRAFT_596602 [Globomyces pollinis-pini]